MGSRKKFVIVLSNYYIGGIEVLVERLSSVLQENYKVYIFILTSKFDINLLKDLEKVATIYLPSDFIKFKLGHINIVGVNSVLPVVSKYRNLISRADYIHATDSHTMVFILSILSKIDSKNKFSIGNYHSEEYLWPSSWWFRKFEKKCIKEFAPENVFSENKFMINKLAKAYGKKFIQSKEIPAGIHLPKIQNSETFQSRKNQLVCLGRLVKFKSYMEYVIKEIPKILIEFPDFEFHIYGDGPERENLRKLSKGLPVYFHGTIELNKISKALSSFKLFIGSGTSILTASAMGIPSIIGIESCKSPITYGFLHETRGYDYQELGLDYQTVPISKKIIEGLKASKEEYQSLCDLARKRSEEFCITKTAKVLETTPSIHIEKNFRWLERFRYLCSVFTCTLLNKLRNLSSKTTRQYLE